MGDASSMDTITLLVDCSEAMKGSCVEVLDDGTCVVVRDPFIAPRLVLLIGASAERGREHGKQPRDRLRPQ